MKGRRFHSYFTEISCNFLPVIFSDSLIKAADINKFVWQKVRLRVDPPPLPPRPGSHHALKGGGEVMYDSSIVFTWHIFLTGAFPCDTTAQRKPGVRCAFVCVKSAFSPSWCLCVYLYRFTYVCQYTHSYCVHEVVYMHKLYNIKDIESKNSQNRDPLFVFKCHSFPATQKHKIIPYRCHH